MPPAPALPDPDIQFTPPGPDTPIVDMAAWGDDEPDLVEICRISGIAWPRRDDGDE